MSSLNFKIHILFIHSYCILRMKAATHFEYRSSHNFQLFMKEDAVLNYGCWIGLGDSNRVG